MTSPAFVIISGGARPASLARLVTSLREQEGLVEPEIVIVGVAAPLPDGARLVPLPDEARRAAICRMRNAGIDATCGDPVILLDDDMEFTHGWWAAFAPRLGTADILGCRVVTPAGARWYDWSWASRADPACPPRMMGYDETGPDAYLSGCFMAIKRAVFTRVRFDETRMNHQKDDVDFCHRAADAGFTLDVVPEATAVHHLDPSGRSASDPAAGPEAYAQGIHLFRLGRYDAALPLLERGESPADPAPARYHRGLALAALGRRDEADLLLQETVTLTAPDGP
ncbi:MAG: glycosyltransferase, partial [Nitrospinae bacterium]|nr:glycosyltransferase [Nitrospinota bacterium]